MFKQELLPMFCCILEDDRDFAVSLKASSLQDRK